MARRRQSRGELGCWLGAGAIVAASMSGCLDRSSVVCDDGSLCPAGTVCVERLDKCVDPEQVAACAGVEDGDNCQTDSIAAGNCLDGVCFAPCGNGILEPELGEACDDGNQQSGDGCRDDCQSDEWCGNGILDRATGEECDCGVGDDHPPGCDEANSYTKGSCRPDCKRSCGDGVLQEDEQCDPKNQASLSCLDLTAGFDRGFAACSDNCRAQEAETCGFLGWRTRFTFDSWRVRDAVMTEVGKGFATVESDYLEGGAIGRIDDDHAAFHGEQQENVEMFGVWAASQEFAVAVGRKGRIVRYANQEWHLIPPETSYDLFDVWGRSPTEFYAVGEHGTVLQFDGSVWTSLSPPTDRTLRGVAGDGLTLYVAGDGGTLLRGIGTEWIDLAPATGEDLRAVWSTAEVTAAVGTGGTIVEVRAGVATLGLAQSTSDLSSVWGSAEEGLFAAGDDGTLLGFDGRVWRRLSLGAGVGEDPLQRFTSITGAASVGETVAFGASSAVSFGGAAWSPTASPSPATLSALWGSAVDDVYAVGQDGVILHHDGLTWQQQPSGTTVDLRAVWGLSPTEVYAVGEAGTVLRYDGIGWTPFASLGSATLRGVWAAADDDLYVIRDPDGDESALVHFDGLAWTEVRDLDPPPTGTARLHAIWGRSASEVWVTGPDGGYRFDGAGWSYVAGAVGERLVGDGVGWWSVDSRGRIVRYDGTGFPVIEQSALPIDRLVAIAIDPSSGRGLFVAGEGGLLAHRSGDTLERMRAHSVANITALWASGDLLFIAGTDGALDVLFFTR